MKHALEPKALLAAAAIGAVIVGYGLWQQFGKKAVVMGAVTGASVQFGVRLLGVS
jgi:hypothetical protein